MARQIDLDQLMKYPLRRGSEHCDEKNADPRFLNGVESILEWAQTLPTFSAEHKPECDEDCVSCILRLLQQPADGEEDNNG